MGLIEIVIILILPNELIMIVFLLILALSKKVVPINLICSILKNKYKTTDFRQTQFPIDM